MSANRSSTTASIVCIARGIGIATAKRDTFATQFSPGWSGRALGQFDSDSRLVCALRIALRAASFGLIDHNTVRMLVIDQYLREWVQSGCSQLVILGAGLDSRCWRMRELKNVRVFELDKQASQQVKLERVKQIGSPPTRPTFVPVDFERDDVAQALGSVGFCPSRPSAWVCEGVTPYLSDKSVSRLWRSIAAVSAVGSRFALSYIAPTETHAMALGRNVVRGLVSKLGEPSRSAVTPATMRQYLESAGLCPLEDLDWDQWCERIGFCTRLPNLLQERLIIGERAVQQ